MSDIQDRPDSFEEGGPEIHDEAPPRPVITLVTDFGLEDHYVGVMKGVILATNPDVQIVDISHSIPPFDVSAGALVLATSYHYFPNGTIHVAVVDPGVGGDRRSIIAATDHYLFVGPDNGCFTHIFDDPTFRWVRHLRTVEFFLEKVSSTFHGRDVYAPVAGHLSLGEPAENFGPLIGDPIRLANAKPQVGEDGCIRGEVIYVDRFGNLITNIDTVAFWEGESRAGEADENLIPVIEACGKRIRGMSEFYGAVRPGEVGAQLNSWSRMEIFIPEGNAARELGAGKGVPVHVRFERAGGADAPSIGGGL
ncbi:MAG: SAM-dependent chlorinase/fluorinase [Candidatus Tectomicrobia bacterium]|uniref:SAM-dependent chlorinase/fluorinase n=1 Tax=Tectimicrobiota bacterium TaxID=2528274 RepID=A0A932MNM5_UNCTE|nr:SAM-dependent chlorinase/fluorinase [Candidatus Tectomicrobia bacterium]